MNRSQIGTFQRNSDRQRLFIMPTMQGYLFSFIVMVIFAATIISDRFEGRVLIVLLVMIGLMSMLMTHYNLKDLVIEAVADSWTPEGGMIEIKLRIHNPSDEPKFSLSLVIQPQSIVNYRFQFWQKLRTFISTSNYNSQLIHMVNEKSIHLVSLQWQTLSRGYYPIPVIRIATRYPIGLFYSWRLIKIDGHCYVYPLPSGLENNASGDEGRQLSNHGGGAEQMDFVGHRDFRIGDTPKHIDWKAYARGRPLLIKEFSGGTSQNRVIRWEDAPQSQTEEKLRQLSLWLHQAHRRGDAYSLELPRTFVPQGDGDAHFYQCLKELAIFHE